MNNDVIERMCRAALEAPHRNCEATFDELRGGTRKLWIDDMTAAAKVLLDEVCGPVTDVEADHISTGFYLSRPSAMGAIDWVSASRRAKIERPKSPEERVMVIHNGNNPGGYVVQIDGKDKFGCDGIARCDAEIYRLGLIAQMKAEADV